MILLLVILFSWEKHLYQWLHNSQCPLGFWIELAAKAFDEIEQSHSKPHLLSCNWLLSPAWFSGLVSTDHWPVCMHFFCFFRSAFFWFFSSLYSNWKTNILDSLKMITFIPSLANGFQHGDSCHSFLSMLLPHPKHYCTPALHSLQYFSCNHRCPHIEYTILKVFDSAFEWFLSFFSFILIPLFFLELGSSFSSTLSPMVTHPPVLLSNDYLFNMLKLPK